MSHTLLDVKKAVVTGTCRWIDGEMAISPALGGVKVVVTDMFGKNMNRRDFLWSFTILMNLWEP